MGLSTDLIDRLAARVRAQSAERARHHERTARPPIDPESLEGVAEVLGFPLHGDLVLVYSQVANGGFGPGDLLLGVGDDGHRSDTKKTADEEYLAFRTPDARQPGWFWPAGVLPVHHWGCGIYSCVDCRAADATMVRFDPNGIDADWSEAWLLEGRSLASWLSGWLDGHDLFACDGPFWTEARSRA